MKKQAYIKPQAEVVAIVTPQILAGSDTIEVNQDQLDPGEDDYIWAE